MARVAQHVPAQGVGPKSNFDEHLILTGSRPHRSIILKSQTLGPEPEIEPLSPIPYTLNPSLSATVKDTILGFVRAP